VPPPESRGYGNSENRCKTVISYTALNLYRRILFHLDTRRHLFRVMLQDPGGCESKLLIDAADCDKTSVSSYRLALNAATHAAQCPLGWFAGHPRKRCPYKTLSVSWLKQSKALRLTISSRESPYKSLMSCRTNGQRSETWKQLPLGSGRQK
jgi:hypothetical protein